VQRIATTSKSGNLTNAGTITLKNADGCGYNASLLLAGGTLTNKGTLEALAGAGGQRLIDASISNAKTIIARAGATLHVTGTYTQTAPGTFTPGSTARRGVHRQHRAANVDQRVHAVRRQVAADDFATALAELENNVIAKIQAQGQIDSDVTLLRSALVNLAGR